MASISVATVLTVYGIETLVAYSESIRSLIVLQQCLPFTVLKHIKIVIYATTNHVATVLTVYGIETLIAAYCFLSSIMLQQCLPFTVLKQSNSFIFMTKRYRTLQQCLPFTVLKHTKHCILTHILSQLQQCLPFTVLKRFINCDNTHNNSHCNSTYRLRYWNRFTLRIIITTLFAVATVLTVYGIETNQGTHPHFHNYVATVLTVTICVLQMVR